MFTNQNMDLAEDRLHLLCQDESIALLNALQEFGPMTADTLAELLLLPASQLRQQLRLLGRANVVFRPDPEKPDTYALDHYRWLRLQSRARRLCQVGVKQ